MKKIIRPARRLAEHLIPSAVRRRLDGIEQGLISAEIDRVRETFAKEHADALILCGYKVHSQCDEDGIIAEIFARIGGPKSKTFCEIGCGNGLENNTHNLVLNGWRGIWIDGSPKHINRIRHWLPDSADRTLRVRQAFVTRGNVNELLASETDALCLEGEQPEIDYLSLDIDGNDLHVLRAITALDPRVISVEYNGKFPPPVKIAMPYNAEHQWARDDYYGASLQEFVDLLASRGYRLVCCTVSGVNAFFVKDNELGDLKVLPVADLYQPPRLHLTRMRSGSTSSFKFLRDQLSS